MAIWIQDKAQSMVQKALTNKQKQEAASTTATQAGSTSTPTVSSTPKVADTKKAVQSQPAVQTQQTPVATASVQQSKLTSLNLFNPSKQTETAQQIAQTAQSQNLLSTKEEEKVDSPSALSQLVSVYNTLPDSMKSIVWDTIKDNGIKILNKIYQTGIRENDFTRNVDNLFSTATIDTARTLISTAQWYLTKEYYSDLLPSKRSMFANMMMPWYALYADKLNEWLSNTQIWKQLKEKRDQVLTAVFDETEKRDQWLAERWDYKEAKKTADKRAEQGKWIKDAIMEWNWDVVTTRVWETIWQMLPWFIAAAASKDPKIAAGTIFWTVFWDSYKRSILEVNNNPEYDHLTPEQKDNLATLMALTEAWIETLWDVVELAPFMKGKKISVADMLWLKNALVRAVVDWQWAAIIEWWEEVITEILQNVFKRAYGWSDRATAKELWDIFSDTFFIMQFIWLAWWVKWWIETHRRWEVEKLLEREAEKFDNFEEFEAEAQRGWIEDEELIQDAWSNAKWLTAEQSAILKRDTKDVQKQEQKAKDLYEEKALVESTLDSLRQSPLQNQSQIKDLEIRLQEIDNKLQDIDKKILQYNEQYGKIPAQQVRQFSQEWWENLSQQTMTSIQINQNEIPTQDRQKMQDSFERSVEQIRKWNVPYNKTDFATYAYWTSWKTIIWNEQQRGVMINKVESLLKRIWITPQYRELWKWIKWRYDQTINWWKVTYKVNGKEITVYGHEVYHAMMDVIMNWELDDKMMQQSLRRDMQEILNEAKEHLWLNDEKYSKGEYRKYADMYAEEWLSNAFWEYLANREITWPNMPKTFLEKVVDFFNRVINFFQSTTNKKTEQELSDAMERVFRTIAEWRVEWWIIKRSPNAQLRQMSAMDESFAETDDELRQTQWEEYDDMVENTKKEQEKLDDWVNEIADNMEQVTTDVNDAEEQWEILDTIIPEIEEIAQQPLDKSIPSTIDAVERSVDKQIRSKEKREAIKSVWEWFKNVLTPALSRLYNISPRLAWAVHTYQATTELKSLWYKKLSTDFVNAMDKLRKKDKAAYRKLSLALFDYWMVDDIDIKEALKEAWIDPKLFEPVAEVLNRIAQDYQAAWLDITINDKYFPRKVKDYWLLLDYMSRKAGKDIKDARQDLLQFIEETNKDATLSEWEKEKRIHAKLINEFTKPSERSNNAKERKLVLSEWQLTEEEKAKGYVNDIIDFYEDPIKSLDVYITDMVKKTELKKMLWWLTAEWTAISEDFDESVAWILLEMEARGELTKEKADEAAHTIRSIINTRATWKWISAIKNATYSLTIANWFSAAQQLEDLSKTLLRWPSWFKNIIKSMIGNANIKMDDTWLDNIFAVFEWWDITNALFKLSWFDMIDSLWKSSFLNTAYDSCVRQANGRKAIILETRLKQMYWESMGTEILNAYKNDQLKDENWNINLSVMVDLLYQLGNTQPIYRSAMPTAYLNNPKARVFYCLMSFTVKQVDWFIQWTKEAYNNQLLLWRDKATAAAAATWRCIWATTLVSVITALVTSLIDWAKWDDDDAIWNKIADEWWLAWLKQLWIDSISWLFKIFNISRYDQYIFKREWIEWVLLSKITPAPVWIASDLFDILVWKKELADLWRYWPLFIKPLYYQFKSHDMLPDYKLRWGTDTKSTKTKSSKFGKTSVWTSWPVNTSKFWWYSVK